MISLFVIVAVYILFYVLWVHVIIPTFISPLSKIPNAHFTSSFSPLWILWKRYAEQENRAIHSAHLKHGEIVRLGPNEVSINCVDGGIRSIYSGGFEKWAWYPNQFENYGVPNMFSMARSKPHSIRKRMVSNVYSKSYLQSSPEMHQITDTMIFQRLLPLLDKLAVNREPVDVLELNFASAMDFIMAYIFGLSNGTNFIQDPKSRQKWLSVYQSRRPFRFWDGELPTLKKLSQMLNIPIVPKWVAAASRELEEWTLRHCKAAEKTEAMLSTNPQLDDPEANNTTTPIVHQQLSTALDSDPNLSSHPTSLQIATELHDHLAAGHETSGITLTYLFHELSLRPSLQAALRTELLTLNPPLTYPPSTHHHHHNNETPPTTPSPRALNTLPLLHACLMETLRIHAAIPGPQPRTTPFPPISLAGSPPLPPGVRVSAQPYSLHRNPHVFPDPEVWKPARWLPTSTPDPDLHASTSSKKLDTASASPPTTSEELTRWFWAFGSGGRMCVGSHFAMQTMKVVTAAVYTNFETRVVDDVGIEQVDAYTAGPRAGQCVLRFERAGGRDEFDGKMDD